MSHRLPIMGEHVCGAELLRRAWEGDAEGIVAGGLYVRSRRALGRSSVALGAGGRRYWFARVESRLTVRQREMLDWICQFIEEHKAAPTVREIGDAFDITSTNGVNDHLQALIRKGYIERPEKGISRLVVLRDANERPPVDWKRRALEAEAEVARLRGQLKREAA